MRTSRAKRTTRAGRQRVGTKKARSNRGTRETRARKTRGSRSRKSADKQLSETLSLPEELIETLSSVLQGPKKSVKGKRPVIEMETSSEPAKKSKTKKKSKKKKSKKPKAWHSKIHGKKSKKGKKKKHKKKMKGGSGGEEWTPDKLEAQMDSMTEASEAAARAAEAAEAARAAEAADRHRREADEWNLRTGASEGKDKTTAQMSSDELGAVAALGFTKDEWDAEDVGGVDNLYDRKWSGMSREQQVAAKTLGIRENDFKS